VHFEVAECTALWGSDAGRYLHELYRRQARCCVVLLSRHHLAKRWNSLESRVALASALDAVDPSRVLYVQLDEESISEIVASRYSVRLANGASEILKVVQNIIAT
jgi:hypothetical protein